MEVGNNIKADGSYRIKVSISNDQKLATAKGIFYLPDNEFLQNKLIVGLKVSFSVGNWADVPTVSPSETVLGGLFYYEQYINLKEYYLTLYDHKNKLVIENLPLMQLNNNNPVGATPQPNKIIPIYGYFNLRQSYIYLPTVTTNYLVYTSLEFFYKN